MHELLSTTNLTTVNSIVQTLQKSFEQRLLDTQDYNENFGYDVLKYEASVLHWRKQFVDIERMGTALLLLYEECRDPKSLRNKAGLKDDILKTSNRRIEEIDKVLLQKIQGWPSYQAILELARADLNQNFPKLWNLEIPDSDKVMVIQEIHYPSPVTYSHGVSYSHSPAVYVPTFTEVKSDSREVKTCRCFGLEHRPDGLWNIRCNRNIARNYDSVPLNVWGTLQHSGKDQIFSQEL
jgi:hypothetical protein